MAYTYTYVVLAISAEAYAEIEEALSAADYDHAFKKSDEYGQVLDMHGIALACAHCKVDKA